MLQHLLLGLVVLVSPRAGKQAVHAPLFGSRYCYVLPLDLAATAISSAWHLCSQLSNRNTEPEAD